MIKTEWKLEPDVLGYTKTGVNLKNSTYEPIRTKLVVIQKLPAGHRQEQAIVGFPHLHLDGHGGDIPVLLRAGRALAHRIFLFFGRTLACARR
jgi:hypothetical protein